MQREIGTILLRLPRGAFRFAGRRCDPPWHRWTRGRVARAERTADGRTHLVVVATAPGGVRVTATGVGAAQAESLAPLAARVRRAIGPDGGLRGTSPFEDAVVSLLDACEAPPRARRAVARLGARCPAAPALRAMPTPADVLRTPRRLLVRATGSAELARRLQALARAFAALAPCPPTAS